MNFITLEQKLPDVFYEIEKRLNKAGLNNQFTIAGGSLCNTYMGLPFRDIDVFVDEEADFGVDVDEVADLFEVPIETITRNERGFGYSGDFTVVRKELCRFEFLGYPVELIFSHPSRVYEFDIRFRQFYYKNGEFFATKEAIQDISNKELVVVTPSTPKSTLCRLFRFSDEFGFSIKQESLSLMHWAFSEKKVDWAGFEEVLALHAHKISATAKNKLLGWVSKTMTHNKGVMEPIEPVFPFHPKLKRFFVSLLAHNKEDSIAIYYDLITAYTPFESFSFDLLCDGNIVKEKLQSMRDLFKSVRLQQLFENDKIVLIPDVLDEKCIHQFFEEYVAVSDELEYHKHKEFKILHLENKIKVEITENPDPVSLGDYLVHNEVNLTIGDTFVYPLRKCTNGKYTIARSTLNQGDGSWFYLSLIGRSLKARIPDYFSFYETDLIGIYGVGHENAFHTDYYFYPETLQAFSLTKKRFKEIAINPHKLLKTSE
jgi:hypothetical protein